MSRARGLLFVMVCFGFAIACGSKNNSSFTDAGSAAQDGGGDDDAGGFHIHDTGPPGCSQNPGNYDFPGDGCDQDGDGQWDNAASCDTGLLPTGNAGAFAKAIGLCNTATDANDPRWGVISAEYKGSWSRGTPATDGQHGILPKFGDVVVPREGATLGVLSTGWARAFDAPDDPQNPATTTFKGGVPMQNGSPLDDAPPGFPKAAAGCPIDSTVHDVIDVKLTIKVPNNAQGFQLDFDFWSGEWPEYVCAAFNDGFIAYLTSSAFNGGQADNISFDANDNPVSVNNGFFDRCTAGTTTGCNAQTGHTSTSTCPGGAGELAGTGFGAPVKQYCTTTPPDPSTPGGATGWLSTSAPVTPGEVITLELIIWDTGDQNFDSSVLLDNFRWIAVPTQVGTQRPPK